MSIISISDDEMEFLDFETNHKSQDGGRPEGRRTGSPFSMVKDGSSSPTSNTSPQDVGAGKRPFFHWIFKFSLFNIAFEIL